MSDNKTEIKSEYEDEIISKGIDYKRDESFEIYLLAKEYEFKYKNSTNNRNYQVLYQECKDLMIKSAELGGLDAMLWVADDLHYGKKDKEELDMYNKCGDYIIQCTIQHHIEKCNQALVKSAEIYMEKDKYIEAYYRYSLMITNEKGLLISNVRRKIMGKVLRNLQMFTNGPFTKSQIVFSTCGNDLQIMYDLCSTIMQRSKDDYECYAETIMDLIFSNIGRNDKYICNIIFEYLIYF